MANAGRPQEEHVDGSHCYDTQNELWVDFKNPSNALFAQLMLVHDIPLPTIDIVLQIINDSSFDSKDLSFRKATDISDDVASFRRTLGMRRARLAAIKTGMPYLILESLIDNMGEDLNQLEDDQHEEPSSQDQEAAREIRTTLRTMSLVHRSWTLPVQHVLRRRVIIRGDQKLQYFMRNPFCGPWVEHMKFLHRTLGSRTQSTWYLLSAFIYRASRLRNVSFSSAHVTQANEGITDVVVALHTLEFSLTVLRLSTRFSCSVPHLNELYELLSTLKCLSVLEISGWIANNNDNLDATLPAVLMDKTPPPSLKKLVWEQRNIAIPLDYLIWLMCARDRYSVTHLSIRFTEGPRAGGAELNKYLIALETTLPTLEVLEMTIWSYLTLRPRYHRLLQSFLTETKQLRHLVIRYLDYQTTGEIDLKLPRTLESLRVMAVETGDDARLASLVRENGSDMTRFRLLRVLGHIDDLFLTAVACQELGVEFIASTT